MCQRLPGRLREVVLLEADILWRAEIDKPEDMYREFFQTWLRVCKNISQSGRPVVLLCAGGIPENAVVATTTYVDHTNQLAGAIYAISLLTLNTLSVVSLFTRFRVSFLPFRLCPATSNTASILMLLGGYAGPEPHSG